MNIEDLRKRKKLIENNLKQLREKVKIDTENLLRLQGALMDISEIIADEEKKKKELEGKEKKKVK